jgi:hypothetical protein
MSLAETAVVWGERHQEAEHAELICPRFLLLAKALAVCIEAT